VGSAILAVGAYELAADVVNDALNERLLPSFVGGVRQFKVSKTLRRVTPPWLRKAMMFALAGAVGAATNSAHGYREASRQKRAGGAA